MAIGETTGKNRFPLMFFSVEKATFLLTIYFELP